jgi:elongation factor G
LTRFPTRTTPSPNWCWKKSRSTPATLKAAIRRLTCKIELVPVLCGSAFKKKGVQVLMDAVVDYLPSPLDVPGAEGHEPGTENRQGETNDNEKFCSLAFKLWTDPYAGKLVFFRVYSGHLKKGDTIYNPRTRKRERVSRLMIIQGSERKDINEVLPATSPRWSACATSPPATRCATRILT